MLAKRMFGDPKVASLPVRPAPPDRAGDGADPAQTVKDKLRVAVVDDNQTNCVLLSHMIRRLDAFQIETFNSPFDAAEAFRNNKIDIGIIDHQMPGMTGTELIRHIRAMDCCADLPLVMVTTFDQDDVRLEALQAGATDFLSKPVNAVEFRARFANIVTIRRAQIALQERADRLALEVEAATRDLCELEAEVIFRLSRAAEQRDGNTGQHTLRVAAYAREIARRLGCPNAFCQDVFLAAPMHDIGKIAIPDAILQKRGPLTEAERLVIESHTTIGSAILDGSSRPVIALAAEIAAAHHERWDGTGYPQGLAGADIPLGARIVAVADVFDALTTPRPYKAAWAPYDALEYLVRGSGQHFDPACVDALVAGFAAILTILADHVDPCPPEAGAAFDPAI
ncbi:HD domain-containing phosphohydrolase [Prosthecomicrobium hirschii]|uniref:HD domain-containing phosphohydrolase n=1 Tax=Prosthecodimorpha hirschii TaxID=665126 RepID=UPI0022200F5A|nr:HD domain-containing phosphohydrolase [Prosthecomicrobium hirschii]MCW1841885.1 response regulator [Prosthecomicrobium hirschii]